MVGDARDVDIRQKYDQLHERVKVLERLCLKYQPALVALEGRLDESVRDIQAKLEERWSEWRQLKSEFLSSASASQWAAKTAPNEEPSSPLSLSDLKRRAESYKRENSTSTFGSSTFDTESRSADCMALEKHMRNCMDAQKWAGQDLALRIVGRIAALRVETMPRIEALEVRLEELSTSGNSSNDSSAPPAPPSSTKISWARPGSDTNCGPVGPRSRYGLSHESMDDQAAAAPPPPPPQNSQWGDDRRVMVTQPDARQVVAPKARGPAATLVNALRARVSGPAGPYNIDSSHV